MNTIGEVRIVSGSDYGRSGFVIEQDYGDFWAIPAWEEAGLPDLAATFPTAGAAYDALVANGLVPERRG